MDMGRRYTARRIRRARERRGQYSGVPRLSRMYSGFAARESKMSNVLEKSVITLNLERPEDVTKSTAQATARALRKKMLSGAALGGGVAWVASPVVVAMKARSLSEASQWIVKWASEGCQDKESRQSTPGRDSEWCI